MSHIHPEIELLRRQYLQLLDPSTLSLPKPQILKRPEIQFQIFNSMFRDGALAYPPPPRYTFRVLKRLVSALEEAMDDPDEDEISDDLASALASAMSHGAEIPVADEAQRKCYVIYTAPCDLSVSEPAPAVTLLESPLLLASAGTTGLRTWEAAKYLASFLYSDSGRTYVSSKAVIELGTGTGLVSLFCAKWLGARYVLATDGTGEVVDTLSANAFLNGLDGSSAFDTAVVKWGHALEGEMLKDEEGERSYSTIVGADVTFDDRSIVPLVSTLHELFQKYPAIEALIAATVRNEETLTKFVQACDTKKFSTMVAASTSLDGEVGKSQQLGLFHSTATEIRIYRIRKAHTT